ncbi:DUF543 domain containing protein [Trichuris trichiura]|uniref:MICOS complex subunit MIC10 n=1 Tax=Trichuris trichiura TaxID=36087 RepID=A0A077Z311_TRITR|nr:DUF543 domain containing protein [Trichuris trichiura]
MQLNSANNLPENEYDNKMARCLSNGIVKCLGGLSIGLLTTVLMAKCMSLFVLLFFPLNVYFSWLLFHTMSVFLSKVMFNSGRTWPMWLGTGVGLGIAYSDCDYDYRKGTIIRGKLIKVITFIDNSKSELTVIAFSEKGRWRH